MKTSKQKSTTLNVQQLEDRAVPADLVNATTLMYQDVDGDDVTVRFSKPILTTSNANTIFTFNTGNVNDSLNDPQQLQSINLTGLSNAAGTTIQITARRFQNTGNALANIGQINATGIDLGAVSISGDLGRIIAGDATTTTPATGAITVQSLGQFGTSTGAPDLVSSVNGRVASLLVKSNIKDARFQTTGGADGSIGTLTVNGSVIGGAGNLSGNVTASGMIGSINVRGDIRGGSGATSGVINAPSIGMVTIGGNVMGGGGNESGRVVTSDGPMGVVRITGSVIGGAGNEGGRVYGKTGMTSANIGGSIVGGTGSASGMVFSDGTIPTVNVRGSIRGNAFGSGQIYGSNLGNVAIGGDVIGGVDGFSGYIGANFNIGNLTINGSIRGGSTGQKTGFVEAFVGSMRNLTVKGDLIGGTASDSGTIRVGTTLGTTFIGGSLIGNTGFSSGALIVGSNAAAMKIGGSIVGGSAYTSGVVQVAGSLASLQIIGDIRGGSGYFSGGIDLSNNVGAISIGGSIVGGSEGVTGFLAVTGNSGAITILGDIIGSSATGNQSLNNTGYIYVDKRMASLNVTGSIIAGTDDTTGNYELNGFVASSQSIGAVTIGGSLIGNATNPVRISANGNAAATATADNVIASITIRGRMEYAHIIGGAQNPLGTDGNADAQIGAVNIAGDFIASSIVAGFSAGTDGLFGTSDDVRFTTKNVNGLFSQIGRVTIGGQVVGTVGGSDQFGILADHLLGLTASGSAVTMVAGPLNDRFGYSPTNDVLVREGFTI